MNVKPGDLIEWMYRNIGKPVIADEYLWSSVKKGWVPIGSGMTHLCVSCDDTTYVWLNEKGLFRASVDDWRAREGEAWRKEVVPCERG
jgi:hypothetical protein